jgi:hypothetical protein
MAIEIKRGWDRRAFDFELTAVRSIKKSKLVTR